MIISDRWIKECIKKNSFIDPDLKVFYLFKAFAFFTPLSDFHRFIFEVIGFDASTILRIRELLSVLGSTKTNPNKSEVTHILCGPIWNNVSSQEKIKKIRA